MISAFGFSLPTIPGQRPEVYFAKILGSDPDFIYRRRFIYLLINDTTDGHFYEPEELDDYGVYEISVKWREDKQGGQVLRRERYWFLMINNTEFPLPQEMVLETLQWIMHYEKATGGDAA